MSFDQKVQQWIQIDNEVKLLNERVKQLREARNTLETAITQHAKTNHSSVIQHNLKLVETKVFEPLTYKYLEKVLGEIIKDDAKVKCIMEHVKQKRAIKIVPEIHRLK